MKDKDKTKEQLIRELEELRQQITQLKSSETKRSHTEEQLKESESKFRLVFENAGGAIFIINIETERITDCNKQAEKLIGRRRNNIIGMHYLKAHPEDEAEEYREKFNSYIKKGHFVDFEGEVQHMDGRRIPVLLGAQTIKLGGKNMIVGILIDIREKKQTEEELRKTKDHLENMIESSLDGIVVCDINGYITSINQSFLQLLGLRNEEVIGKHMVEFGPMEKERYKSTIGHSVQIDEKYFEDRKRMYNKFLKVGKIHNWEGYLVNKDKKVVSVEHNMVLLHNKEGDITGAVGIIRDITKRKQLEEETRETKEFLENIFKTSVDGVVVSDSNGFITMTNTATEKMVGHSQDELIGKHLVELLPKGIQHKEKGKEYQKRLVEEGSIRGIEHVWARKDGSLFDVDINASLLKNNEGDITGVVAGIRDITERKKAEKVIKEGKEFLESVLENSMDGIAITDGKGHIISLNTALEKMCQFRKEELIGKHISTLTIEDKDLREKLIEKAKELFEKGFAKFEAVNKTKDGTHINVACHNSLIKDARGDIIAAVSIIRDITDRKLVEEEIRKFKTIADQANYGVVIVDIEGNLIYANGYFTQMHGYTVDEIIGQNIQIFHNEEQVKRVRELNKQLFDKGHFVAEEVWHKRRDGTTFPTLMSATVIRDEEDKLQFLAATILDITERKKAEKEIKETRDFLENIFKASADGIMVSDSHGLITMANEATQKMLGYTNNGLIGKHTMDLVPNDKKHQERGRKLIERLYKEGIVTEFETAWLKKDGSLVDIELNVDLLKSSDGNYIGAVAGIRDITERKQAEKKLVEYQNQLRSLASQLTLTEEQERRKLAESLHDCIGQSLFISKIKLEMLQKSGLSSDSAKILDEALKLIEQMINDTRSLTFELSPPILYQLGFEPTLEWLIEQIEKQYGIRTDFEDDKQLKPLDDDMRIILFRAVRELLINVVKHAQAQKVKVSTRRNDGKIQICVEDDGIGFTLSKTGLFDLENKRFGLFSIKERLDQLGGHFKMESTPHHGTRMTIEAPLKLQE